jgi:hypothetical protein
VRESWRVGSGRKKGKMGRRKRKGKNSRDHPIYFHHSGNNYPFELEKN